MNDCTKCEIRLLSWNILAPCWVNSEWYPSLYGMTCNHIERVGKIGSTILTLGYDVVLIQEAQEDMIPLLKQKLDDNYNFYLAWNYKTTANVNNGLLTLIRKDWKYAPHVTVNSEILDMGRGEAIQILSIPCKNIHIVNVHLDYTHHMSQARMVKDKFRTLLNDSNNSITILAGDMNADSHKCDQFEWNDLEDVFHESMDCIQIPTFYPDPMRNEHNAAIDHIFYDKQKLTLVAYGKAFDKLNATLEEAISRFGSDHIYVWACFNFSA